MRMHRNFVRKLSGDYTFLKFCIIIYNKLIGNANTQKVCKKVVWRLHFLKILYHNR